MKSVKTYLLALMAAIPHLLFAQTAESTNNDIKWSIESSWNIADLLKVTAYNSSGSKYCNSMSTGILKMDDNSAISNIQLDKNNYGTVRLNKDLSVQWLSKLGGYPIAISTFHDNILVITTEEISTLKGASNNFKGYVIDQKTGKILFEKPLYTPGNEFYEQQAFLISANGACFKLAVRTSKLTKAGMHLNLAFNQNKSADAYFETADFKIMEFDNNLDLKSTIKPVLEQGNFTGATINDNGDVFLMTEDNETQIKIARYPNGQTTPIKVLSLNIDMGDKKIYNLNNQYVFTSKADPLVIFYAAIFPNSDKEHELVVAKYNFKDGTVMNNSQVMDKAYLKDLKKNYVPFSKKFDDVDLGNRDYMGIGNILENDGKLIVNLSSYDEEMGNASMGISARYIARDLIFNIYDNKLNLQFQQIIPRKYTSFGIGFYTSAGMFCKNNVLNLTGNTDKGINGSKVLFGQIDLKTGSILNIDFIGKNAIKNKYDINPSATLWFDDKFILSYIEIKGWSAGSTDAHLQLVDY